MNEDAHLESAYEDRMISDEDAAEQRYFDMIDRQYEIRGFYDGDESDPYDPDHIDFVHGD